MPIVFENVIGKVEETAAAYLRHISLGECEETPTFLRHLSSLHVSCGSTSEVGHGVDDVR